MVHPIWSNIFRGFQSKESQTEIALKLVPVFENLKKRELREIGKIVHERDFLKDEYVFKCNTPGLGMYIIIDGEIIIEGDDGTEFARLTKGDFFGETALINDDKRNASAKAFSDSKVIAFFRSDLLEIIRRNPVFGTKILFNLSNIMTKRLRKSNNLIQQSKDKDNGK